MEALQELLKNKLFLEYLSGAGQALSEGKSIAEGLSPVTKQNISAQNKLGVQNAFIKALQDAISGGAGIKADAKGVSFNLPHALVGGTDPQGSAKLFSSLLGESEEEQQRQNLLPSPQTISEPVVKGSNTKATTSAQPQGVSISNFLRGLLNPSFSPVDISSANLAGLSTTDLSQALTGALGFEQMRQKSLTDAAEMLSKDFQMNKEKIDPESLPSPIQFPGSREAMSIREFKSLDENTKSYLAYAKLQQLSNPNEPILSQKEWRNIPEGAKIEYLRALQGDPELFNTAIKLAEASRPTTYIDTVQRNIDAKKGGDIGDIRASDFVDKLRERINKDHETIAMEVRKMLNDPKYKDVENIHIQAQARTILLRKAIDERLRKVYGQSLERRKDGWYVDGKLIQEVPE